MDRDKAHIEALRSASLFIKLDDGQLQQILAHCERRTLEGGHNLFTQGDRADHFFWLRSGLLKLYRISPMGEEKIIEIVRPGQTFAEAIMFVGQPGRFPVNAQMIEAGEVWCFSSQTFIEILRGSVDTCFRLMAGLSQRLHQHVNEIDRLTLQTATDRVVNYLLQNRSEGSDQIQLITAKQTLAAQLSIKPETLSRTFARLSKEGLIRIEGNQITLLDLAALQKRVELYRTSDHARCRV